MEAGVEFLTGKHVRARFDVSSSTLRNWAGSGRIRFIVAPDTGTRRYALADVAAMCGQTPQETPTRDRIIYARVSSAHQRDDLKRQVEALTARYPHHEVIQDIGSGLNFKRRGFQALLERVYRGRVDEVVVAHNDRLCRFGRELVDFIFGKTGTKLVVCDVSRRSDPTAELADDLLSIATVFVAKENGRRSADNRKRRREEAEGRSGGKGTIVEDAEDSCIPDTETA